MRLKQPIQIVRRGTTVSNRLRSYKTMRGSVDPPAGGGTRRGRLPDPAGLSWRHQPLPSIPEAAPHWPSEEDDEECSIVAKQQVRKKRRTGATIAAALLALAGAAGVATGVQKVANGRREARVYRNLMARVEASEYTDDEKERVSAIISTHVLSSPNTLSFAIDSDAFDSACRPSRWPRTGGPAASPPASAPSSART